MHSLRGTAWMLALMAGRSLRLGTACLLVLVVATSSRAVELRTTSGDRTIYRTVSYETEVLETGAEVLAPTVIDSIGTSCSACGTAGCELGCLQSCGKWADFDYLLWWRRGANLPPLVTSSTAGTPLNQAGVLGLPTTQVLFGGATYGEDAAPGGRIRIGGWLDDCACNSIEGRFFALGRQTTNYSAASNGQPILARPFDNRDPLLGPLGPTSRPLAFPGIATNGSAFVRHESDVYGGDVVMRRRTCDTGQVRIDFVFGYQFSRVNDELTIGDSFVDIDPGNIVVDGTRQDIVDRFETENEFHGALIGLDAVYRSVCWRLELMARIGFGNMRQMVNIAGQTTNDVPGDPGSPFVIAEGLLAGAANSGRRQRDEFVVVPELGASMVYELSDCVDVSFGYSFIYWSSVVQAGQQIDPNLFVPSNFVYRDNSFWVHGLNAGVEMQF